MVRCVCAVSVLFQHTLRTALISVVFTVPNSTDTVCIGVLLSCTVEKAVVPPAADAPPAQAAPANDGASQPAKPTADAKSSAKPHAHVVSKLKLAGATSRPPTAAGAAAGVKPAMAAPGATEQKKPVTGRPRGSSMITAGSSAAGPAGVAVRARPIASATAATGKGYVCTLV